jgi:Protein of unknown function (DUF3617)
MRYPSLIVVAIVLLSAQAAEAQSPQPGLCRMTTTMQRMEISGMPSIPPLKHAGLSCLTPEMVKDPTKGFQALHGREARYYQYNSYWTGAELTFELTCGGPSPLTVKGSYTFESPTLFLDTGSVIAPAGEQTMTIQMEAEHVGDCSRYPG